MKVLSVSHYYAPHTGGLEIVAKKQNESLADAGYEVTAFTCAAKGEKYEEKNEGKVRVIRQKANNFFDNRFGIPFPIFGFWGLKKLWKEISKTDVVHIHDVFYFTSWSAYFFSRLMGRQIFLTQHVGIVDYPNPLILFIERCVYKIFGTLIFKKSEAIIVYNDKVKSFLLERQVNPEKIREIRNGIDVLRFSPVDLETKKLLRKKYGLDENKTVVLFVGRFVPKKGFNIVYEARDSSYDLVFVGSGNFPTAWSQEPGVHNFGIVNYEILPEIYQLADLFVLPTKGEVFTLAMQEAMAAGLPIILAEEPAYFKYKIDRSRLIFCEASPDQVRSAIKQIINDYSKQETMSNYSLELARELFDWQTNVKQLLSIYSERVKKKEVVVTTSWDDGHRLDLKLADLLKKYKIGATFYISPEDHEINEGDRLTREEVKQLANNFEIGAHTMTHRHLTKIDNNEAEEEIKKSKILLESWVGTNVASFCYPAGFFSPIHKEMVKNAGFLLARTVRRFFFAVTPDHFELPTSVHTYDHWSDAWQVAVFSNFNPVKFFGLYRRWDNLAIAMFDKVVKHGGIFHLWGHSWEIEKRAEWERLERVFQYISGRDGVAYLSNKEIL